MKKILLWLCLIPIGAGSQPYLMQNFDGTDTIPGQFLPILLDTSATNIWQIGPPQKAIFDSPYSIPNVLVTDTINLIPDSTSSYFQFSYPDNFWPGLLAIQWTQKLDLADSTEMGYIEYSIDTGSTWVNVFTDPNVYNFYGYLSQNSGYHYASGEAGFTGTDTNWRDIWLCYPGSYFEQFDTTIFRFTIETDTMEFGSEGWMIDNFSMHETWVHTLTEQSNNAGFVAYPTKSNGAVTIKYAQTDTPPIIKEVQVINLAGQVVMITYPETSTFELDLSSYFAGLYKIKIITNSGFDICSFILEK